MANAHALSKKIISDSRIVAKKRLSPDNYLLVAEVAEPLPEIIPGQFAEILIENASSIFLRRPFSIHDVDYHNNSISFLVKIVGEGTRQLCYLEVEDYVNVIYPLGRGFTIVEGEDCLLVGGGCGVAPLLYLAKQIVRNGGFPEILIGGRSAEDILQIEAYHKVGKVNIATEDGSLGTKGLVTNHPVLAQLPGNIKKIYTCGPNGMMKAVAAIAGKNNCNCEVSLENTMACGFGVCLCCVVNTTTGNRCVCTEGPVFTSNDLKW